MSDKEARLASEFPGDIIVDGFVFKASEIVSVGNKYKYLKITCHFEHKNDAEFFINTINKPVFDFCIPGMLDHEKAQCSYWVYFGPWGEESDCIYSVCSNIMIIRDAVELLEEEARTTEHE